jgi:hypothetical protein
MISFSLALIFIAEQPQRRWEFVNSARKRFPAVR